MNCSGDITMWVVPSRQAVFSLNTTYPARFTLCRSLAMVLAGDISAQVLKALALCGATAHCAMQAKAVCVGAQRLCVLCRAANIALQAQNFAPRPWPKRDAPGAGGRLQGCEHVIGIGHLVRIRQIRMRSLRRVDSLRMRVMILPSRALLVSGAGASWNTGAPCVLVR
jgi:hypothetical protein